MMQSSRWLLVLGVSALAGGSVSNLFAQDDLEALLKDVGGKDPAPAVQPAAPAAEAPAPAKPAAQPAAEAPAPAPAPAPAAAPAPAKEPTEADAIISELETLEKIRRKSLDDHGYAALDMARQAMIDKNYDTAAKQYKQALEFIGDRPQNLEARKEAEAGIGEAYYQDALRLMKLHENEDATTAAAKAKEAGHPKAPALIDVLRKEPEKEALRKAKQTLTHRQNESEYKQDRTTIRKRLRRSRQLYTTGELGRALEECELVLRDFPFDFEALELRDRIADRMKNVSDLEFEATRSMMIRDVRDTWNDKRYAINSTQLPNGKNELSTKEAAKDIISGRTAEQVVHQKLQDIVIPEVNFRPPATIIDAVDFFKIASRDYDKPEIPVEQRGVNLVLKLPSAASAAPAAGGDDVFGGGAASGDSGNVPVIPSLTARFINLYDALKLVCDVTGMKFRIRGNVVMVVPANEPDGELFTRSYNVLASLTDRVNAAKSEMQNNQGGLGSNMDTADMSQTQDWKQFFGELGVQWPEGSTIAYIAAIGKLRVRNTTEQLAVFEQILEDLNVTPRLIEIEARFVEVSQADLNSLGFEWLLNSDFSFDAGGFLDKALNLREHGPATTYTDSAGNTHNYYSSYLKQSRLWGARREDGTYVMNNGTIVPQDAYSVLNGQYGLVSAPKHNASIGAIDGTTYSTGMRYTNTTGNPVAGEDSTINDQFLKLNAFLGNADISVILHMLSQRSDTDTLSAPKVVTKNGNEAVMKVVTEYIYPTEFEVEISQQSNSGSSIYGSNSGMTLATVEPQNFETREVGVILQVVPEVSPEGQMINLILNPQVVSEPTWKNYGMKIPYFRNSNSLTDMVTGFSLSEQDVEYMELPMEQPFFSVRSVNTQLSVFNGATVVMGGLITEDRTTIEDKIPFLGDIPYLGRIFRSKAESSKKRNLLVFVTARLVDPAGRVIKPTGESALEKNIYDGADNTPAGEAPVAAPAAEPAAAD